MTDLTVAPCARIPELVPDFRATTEVLPEGILIVIAFFDMMFSPVSLVKYRLVSANLKLFFLLAAVFFPWMAFRAGLFQVEYGELRVMPEGVESLMSEKLLDVVDVGVAPYL